MPSLPAALPHLPAPSSPPLPPSIPALLLRFFTLIESKDPDVGETLATSVFTPDGVATAGEKMRFEGFEELKRSRDNAWRHIAYRFHAISKIYVSAPEPDQEGEVDLLMTGKLKLKLVDGSESESEFVQRVVFVGEGEETRMRLVEVWADSAPLREQIMNLMKK